MSASLSLLDNIKKYDALVKLRKDHNVFGAGLTVKLNIGPMENSNRPPIEVSLAAAEPMLTDVLDAVIAALRDTMQIQSVVAKREQGEATDALLFYSRSEASKRSP